VHIPRSKPRLVRYSVSLCNFPLLGFLSSLRLRHIRSLIAPVASQRFERRNRLTGA
jgi:hypothetical protein